ncbi:MAG: ATP-dependent zinc metalloprotease FtsH [Acholeplasmatales bacterium]
MNEKQQNKSPLRGYGIYIIFALILLGTFLFLNKMFQAKEPERLSLVQFETLINDGELNGTTITYNVVATDLTSYRVKVYKGDKLTYDFYVTSSGWAERIESIDLSTHSIELKYIERSGVSFWDILSIALPIVFIVILGVFLWRTMSGGGANKQAFDFAKSRARLASVKTVTFKDVAGIEEEKQELEEIIDFLKYPKKYRDIGARIPKGVLLVGAPGTGKTLLAKAVAGEANVPFFSISGSDFVEMFVGVGASRVRDLFKVAKENSPCIIFIDEIDAVGRQRGAGMGGGHDEREQTLNQLLVEMDGFNPNAGIIIMAATNRPDVLDPALLRPGRFDRQITIDLPDVKGRESILKVHARNKRLDDDVNFENLAMRIPGFSGADIENLLNEAALLAARGNRKVISLEDLDEAMDRVMLGPAKRSRKVTERERKVIAYHEAGHAVIGLKLEGSNIVQKVTIVARGQAGGYNLMMPEEETFLETKTSLLARITGYLGGRVAEEIVFGDVTTGAYQDFQTATKIARAMVTEYGMSDLGPIQYESNSGNVFLGRDYFKEKNFSDQVALEIDREVREIISEAHVQATTLINKHRKLLDTIANYLLKVETLTKQDIDEIVETGTLKRAYKEENNNTEEKKETPSSNVEPPLS